jgi:hypothetical protein
MLNLLLNLPQEILWKIYNYTIHPNCYIVKNSVSSYRELSYIPLDYLIKRTVMIRELEYYIKLSIRRYVEALCFFLSQNNLNRKIYDKYIYSLISYEQDSNISPLILIKKTSFLSLDIDLYNINIPHKVNLLNFTFENRNILFSKVFSKIILFHNYVPQKFDKIIFA